MMKLRELLGCISSIPIPDHHPALEIEVTGLSTNSRDCKTGDLFLGLPGTKTDGGEFWPSALSQGAIAALVSPKAWVKTDINGSLIIPIEDMIEVSAKIAAAFYDHPAQKLKLVGVTGTNGKTTTTHLIEFFLNQSQRQTALFGTLYARWSGYQETASHTTPFAVDLQKQLAQAVQGGCEYGVMEVSSHALAQRRVLGCKFPVTVFTNLTQDHLDYHLNMEDYFEAKARLFSPDYLEGKAILNQDDPYGQRLIQRLGKESVWTYSITDSTADLWADQLIYQPQGVTGVLHTPQGEINFNLPLVGQYNLANLLAAVGASLQLGVKLSTIEENLPQFSGVPGRVERVFLGEKQQISVIVDYAHTPDSLENLLKASRPFIPGRMICVFGCGGDRDRTKRPKMGKIAADLADQIVVTSDNPRTEDPQKILEDILAGIPEPIKPIVEADRAKAIRQAILNAQPGDGVLIAGKGHEDYQILGTEKIHFDDREQAREALLLRESSLT